MFPFPVTPCSEERSCLVRFGLLQFHCFECGLFITATSVRDLTLTHIDTQRLGGLRSSKNAWDWRLCLRTGRNTETARHRMSNVALELSVLKRNAAGYFQMNDYLIRVDTIKCKCFIGAICFDILNRSSSG